MGYSTVPPNSLCSSVLMHCQMGWHILLCPMLYLQSPLSILSSKNQLFVSHALSMLFNPGWSCEWHDLTEHSDILDKCNQQGVAVFAITFSNRTISRQFLLVYGHNWHCTVAMFRHTRERVEPSLLSSVGPSTKKHAVSRRTVEKWVVMKGQALITSCGSTLTPIDTTFSLKCAVCSQF